jgi:hypothetical protein
MRTRDYHCTTADVFVRLAGTIVFSLLVASLIAGVFFS